MSSDTAPSALGSRRFSYLYSARITWGGWGSNPRPADYEKYGLVHRTHYLHGYHGAVPPMALIALLAPMARSTNRSTPTPLHRASLLLYVTSLGIRPHKWTRLSAPDGLTGAVMCVLACQYVAGYRNSLREGASVYPCGDGPVETPAFGLGPRRARGARGWRRWLCSPSPLRWCRQHAKDLDRSRCCRGSTDSSSYPAAEPHPSRLRVT